MAQDKNGSIYGGGTGLGGNSGGSDFLSILTSILGMGTGSVIPGIGGILSILGGFFGAGDSPQDEATKMAMEKINAALPWLQSTPYSKGEVSGLVSDYKQNIDVATNIAEGSMGATLAEGMGAAGVPKGQPQGSMYVSEIAPLEAGAVKEKAGMDKWGAEFFASMDEQTKANYMNALQVLTGGALAQPGMTGTQRGIATGLNIFDLFGKGAGNLASMYAAINKQYIKP